MVATAGSDGLPLIVVACEVAPLFDFSRITVDVVS
jgi:hypothetical protein